MCRKDMQNIQDRQLYRTTPSVEWYLKIDPLLVVKNFNKWANNE